MKQRLMFGGIAVALLAVVASFAIAANADTQPKGVESDVVALPPPPKDEDVVAKVGDKTLTWGELKQRVAEETAGYEKASGMAVPEEMREAFEQNVRMNQVQYFIESNLIANAAAAAGVKVDDAAREAFKKELQAETGRTLEQLLAEAPYGKERAQQMIEQSMLAKKLFDENAELKQRTEALVKEKIAGLDTGTSCFFNHRDPAVVENLAGLVRNV